MLVNYDIFKHKFLKNLEKKYSKNFALCKNNGIMVFPPIIKKIGLVYNLAFIVCDKPENEFGFIKRPIGIIIVNKNGKEKLIDLKDFEFCYRRNDFEIDIYKLKNNKNFWPDCSNANIEKIKKLLELLEKVFEKTTIFKKPNHNNYKSYIIGIKEFIPTNYWYFFEQLNTNKIFKVTKPVLQLRKNASAIHEEKLREIKSLRQKKIVLNRQIFSAEIKQNMSAFIKKEVLPSLNKQASYTKLIFFKQIGKYIKQLNKNLNSFENCYDPMLTNEIIEKNKLEFFEKQKVEIIKLYSSACQNNAYKIARADVLSKVLIVFLNALLVEELHKKVFDAFEQEINECKKVFADDYKNLDNEEIKIFLKNCFDGLCSDYTQTKEDEFSDLFEGYLLVFAIPPNLGTPKD